METKPKLNRSTIRDFLIDNEGKIADLEELLTEMDDSFDFSEVSEDEINIEAEKWNTTEHGSFIFKQGANFVLTHKQPAK